MKKILDWITSKKQQNINQNQKQLKDNLNQNQLHLQFQFNQQDIKNIEQFIKYQGINKNTKQANFNYKKLTSKHLALFLRSQNSINTNIIQSLSLQGNQINDQGIKYLCYQQCKWTQLKILKLYKNNISIKGFQYLSRSAQKKCFPQLKQLNLGKNIIGSQNIEQLLKQEEKGLLLNFANQNTKLKQFSLSSNYLNDDVMKILFRSKQKDKKVFNRLWKLSLSENMIKDKCLVLLTGLNIQYPSLLQLWLIDNQINIIGIKNLVSYKNKKTLNSLRELYLDDNPFIRDEGIYQIIKGCHLGALPKLQKLMIRNIKLSNNSIESIIKLYDQSKILKFLNLINIQHNSFIGNRNVLKKNIQKRLNQKSKCILGMCQQQIVYLIND